MQKYSLYTILFGLLLFLGLIFSLSIYLSTDYQRQELIKTAIDEKIRFAATISNTIFSQTWIFRAAYYPGVEEAFLSQMGQFPDLVFLRVVDIKGNIRRSGFREEVGQTIEDSDIARAVTKGEVISKEAVYKEEKINLIIYPSPNENVILVGFSLKGIEEITKMAITRNAVVGFGAMLFVLFISYFVFRSIIDPLKRMTKSCEEARKGNLGVKIETKSKTEIGELATTFNEMIKSLRESRIALEETRTMLEAKVESRTQELKTLAEKQEEIIKEGIGGLEAKTEDLGKSRKALMNMLEDVGEERRKAEGERDKTSAIIANLADGLMVFDPGNRLILANSQAEKFFGIQAEQIVNQSIFNLVGFPTLIPLIDLVKKGKKGLEGIFREELIIRGNLIIEVSTVSIKTEEEKLGTLLILHDITREKGIEKLKTEFVSLAAHQLRTPISAIKWILRTVLDGDTGRITKEQKEILEKGYRSNERMISLVNDLLNVARIEEGRFLYSFTSQSIEGLIEKIIAGLEESIKRRKIKVIFEKPPAPLPNIKVDAEKIELAIANIIDNSIVYNKEGGMVTISVKADKMNNIEIMVEDTGIGIPEHQQERLFSKFFRGDNAVRLSVEGAGLGLFITKNIIEAHGGKIWLESKENKGATFWVSIPIK